MKSIQVSAVLFSLMVAACGDSRRSVDVQAFIPKMPVAETPVAIVKNEPAAKPDKIEPALPTTFDDAMTQGKDLVGKGSIADAKLMFETAAKLDKKRSEPHIELAKIYIASNERGLAMAAANKAVKLAPLSSQAWNTKGRAELNRFAYDDAIEAFTKATELNKDNVWAWNNLGYTELQLKKYDEAAAHLQEATSRPGAQGFMFNNLGTALEHLDRLDEARTAFDGGAKLGSKESISSRKRLEGVKSIAISDTPDKPDVKPDVKHTFDNGEGPSQDDSDVPPEPEAATPDAGVEVKPEAPTM